MDEDWTDDENKAVIEDYFTMLREELLGRPVNKAARARSLLLRLNGRSHSAVEWKRRNISAALAVWDRPHIAGYLPADHFQRPLAEAIERIVDLERFYSEMADAPTLNPTSLPVVTPSLDDVFQP